LTLWEALAAVMDMVPMQVVPTMPAGFTETWIFVVGNVAVTLPEGEIASQLELTQDCSDTARDGDSDILRARGVAANSRVEGYRYRAHG
jgi:hypothetical protein